MYNGVIRDNQLSIGLSNQNLNRVIFDMSDSRTSSLGWIATFNFLFILFIDHVFPNARIRGPGGVERGFCSREARNIIKFNYHFQRCHGKDKIPLAELKNLLGDVGLDLPNYQLREILNKLRHDSKDEFVTKAQFLKVGNKYLNNPS